MSWTPLGKLIQDPAEAFEELYKRHLGTTRGSSGEAFIHHHLISCWWAYGQEVLLTFRFHLHVSCMVPESVPGSTTGKIQSGLLRDCVSLHLCKSCSREQGTGRHDSGWNKQEVKWTKVVQNKCRYINIQILRFLDPLLNISYSFWSDHINSYSWNDHL